MNPDAYLPVNLALLKLSLKWLWASLTGGSGLATPPPPPSPPLPKQAAQRRVVDPEEDAWLGGDAGWDEDGDDRLEEAVETVLVLALCGVAAALVWWRQGLVARQAAAARAAPGARAAAPPVPVPPVLQADPVPDAPVQPADAPEGE
ncbi:hypothetical protein BDK51DRAFT_36569 [Blyttiomyces helicus]|uniref:Uncharacterized protein n=1 Tax=Blyttiomyces helicus TaxID=388810 RepID=A0A4P9WCV8_9FUNG|nr:hypothetical protein BDK51DRAFT_36569 [Blyttiomyces helicus]|eukprot:RKO88750.1 hypothetical protein BDK51DRAFT_36569 [Blyttiomyces helicus]